jgi:FlaA1/EpsC-like NDP-sugar epimerase
LFYAERQLAELGAGASAVPLVADIMDAPRMQQIFARHRPALVYHAAAHKHVFMMERQPAEAVHNNALGTRRLAQLAIAHGAKAFVLISTDKAINPTSVMGATKRLAELELQCLHARGDHQTKLMAVRFGNVLGSSGSVIPIFKEQIARGGPVTVTHPDVTRYFMTIPEAVGLVLQCSVQGNGGEIFVLDMGQPIKIVELARQMITLSGYRLGEDIEIKFTGLKPGEKMFEELQHRTEKHQPTAHPRIMRFVADKPVTPGRNLEELLPGLYALDNSAVKQLLKELVVEYTPHLD